jgi:hypothetical protein
MAEGMRLQDGCRARELGGPQVNGARRCHSHAGSGTTVARGSRMPNPDVNPAAESSLSSYEETPVLRPEHREGRVTRIIEQQSAKVPSNYFLMLAFLAMVSSLGFELAGRQRASRFVGMWPTPLLVMGVYNKLVKVLGPR